MARTVPTLEAQYIYNYPVPTKEGVQVFRFPPDARGGDTYQVVADVEATAEECFKAITDFKIMQETSSVIDEIKVIKEDDEGAVIAMRCKPEIDTGVFHYRYAFDKPNTQMFFWMYDYEGPNRQWYAINVETRVYQFEKFSRIILTETFVMMPGVPNADATGLFTGVGLDMIQRIKNMRAGK
ncbi:MAG: hypothetical protein D6734_01350 [Candidatus Schekmanbacteria bacterium]|nr:MAG: hypothetical protein D6734_01350 [Candidatus Schekmanbacteria bacterium]